MARKTRSTPSIQLAANSTASSVNRNAKPATYPQISPTRPKKRCHPLRSKKNRFILRINGRVQISGPEDQPGRHPLYTRADQATPAGKPAHTLDQALRSVGVAPGQWSVARHGVPRPVAYAGPCRPDQVAAGELRAA